MKTLDTYFVDKLKKKKNYIKTYIFRNGLYNLLRDVYHFLPISKKNN